jgi:hypothetical protein
MVDFRITLLLKKPVVTLTIANDSRLDISWDAVIGADSYNLQHRKTNGDVVNTPNVSSPFRHVHDPNFGGFYEYIVDACSGGECVRSDRVSGRIPKFSVSYRNDTFGDGAGRAHLFLRWDRGGVGDSEVFRLSKSESPNGPFQILDITKSAPAAVFASQVGDTVYVDIDVEPSRTYYYKLEVDGLGGEVSADGMVQVLADFNGNGLIEISNLTMLHNMRHNPTGTSYREARGDVGNTRGCPARGCNGYELNRNLNFDIDGDGRTWSEVSGDFRIDADDSNDLYFPSGTTGDEGWAPIPSFSAIFDGNGFTINGLTILRDEGTSPLGMFGAVNGGQIRNFKLDNVLVRSHSADATGATGGLVGLLENGSITGVDITADISFSAIQYIGGLAGIVRGSNVVDSHARISIVNIDRGTTTIGGLIGKIEGLSGIVSNVIASSASGDIHLFSNTAFSLNAGGLIGEAGNSALSNNNIWGSFARVDIEASLLRGNLGGLVGNLNANVFHSYATGSIAASGIGDFSFGLLGGLVGDSRGTISDSYAIVDISQNSIEARDSFAGKIGGDGGGNTRVYGFGSVPSGFGGNNGDISVGNAENLAITHFDNGEAIWDFSLAVAPILKYADYDGAGGNDFACSTASIPPNAIVIPKCGELLPGQEIFIADKDGDGLIEIDSLAMLHNMRYNPEGTSDKRANPVKVFTAGCPAAGCSGYELTRDLDFDKDGDGKTWRGDPTATLKYALDADDNDDIYFPVPTAEGADAGWIPIPSFNATFEGNGHTINGLAIIEGAGTIGPHIGMFETVTAGGQIRNLKLDNVLIYAVFVNSSQTTSIEVGGLMGSLEGRSQAKPIVSSVDITVDIFLAGGLSDIGGLVGNASFSNIVDSHAKVSIVNDNQQRMSRTGGLVGIFSDNGGFSASDGIVASSASGDIELDGGTEGIIGGSRNIRTGFSAGGLVGFFINSSSSGGSPTVIGSFATVNITHRNGEDNLGWIGGLVGSVVGRTSTNTSIQHSYAVGNLVAGDETVRMGLLTGRSTLLIADSYAISNIDVPVRNIIRLIDPVSSANGTRVYGFLTFSISGGAANSETIYEGNTLLPATALELDADHFNFPGVWDFGDHTQRPVLKYFDYDGGGNGFTCNPTDSGVVIPNCESGQVTLIPGQGR